MVVAVPKSRTGIPIVPWDVFQTIALGRMKQGDHVSLIGPTKRGKSTLALRGVLPVRAAAKGYLVIMDVKSDDPTLRQATAFKVIRNWPPRHISPENRYFRLAPPAKRLEDIPSARRVFGKALADIYADGFWTVYIDEVRAMVDPNLPNMGQRAPVEALWLFGRSRNLTLVASSQAPRWVPSAMYDQASHLFVWKNRDERALKRLAEIGGDTTVIQQTVRHLEYHQFLYIDNIEDRMMISTLEK